jgi:hypothetical protein
LQRTAPSLTMSTTFNDGPPGINGGVR